MTEGNSLVWEILTEDEKSALLLSINYSKSSWQAGEIMNKAHYKYLEIQARANKFFKMFNEYFVETKNLRIPPDCYLDVNFRDYIILTLFERKSQREAIEAMGNSPFILPSARERILKENLDMLNNHENELFKSLYDLIIEFDRWNNARILPMSLQEPSAFKRRNKARLIKHLKNLSNLDEYHVIRFIDKFKAKPHRKCLYISVLSKNFENGYDIIKIKNNKEVIEYVSKNLRLYVFNEEVDADQFGYLVNKYLKNPKKDCKTGQKFWPLYRKTIETAFNYHEVNNIIPRRKYLEKAFRDMDELIIRRNDKKSLRISDPQPRIKEDYFYGTI